MQWFIILDSGQGKRRNQINESLKRTPRFQGYNSCPNRKNSQAVARRLLLRVFILFSFFGMWKRLKEGGEVGRKLITELILRQPSKIQAISSIRHEVARQTAPSGGAGQHYIQPQLPFPVPPFLHPRHCTA